MESRNSSNAAVVGHRLRAGSASGEGTLRRFGMLASSAMLLAACSTDQVTGPDQIGPTENKAAAAAATATSGTNPVMFNGGRVITSGLNIYSIYWSASTIYQNGPRPSQKSHSGANDNTIIGHFLRNLGGSPWFNILTTYNDNRGVKIPNRLTYTGWWANNTNAPAAGSSVFIADLARMLENAFARKLLTYDPNTIYTVFTGRGVNLGGDFGTSYCAFHTAVNVKVGTSHAPVMIIGIPYVWQEPWRCTAFSRLPSPNNQPDADGAVNVLAHEIAETATNGFGRGWYDQRQLEIGDKCVWNFGANRFAAGGSPSPNANMRLNGVPYLVQMLWVNARGGNGGCVGSY